MRRKMKRQEVLSERKKWGLDLSCMMECNMCAGVCVLM